jgi:hypothetical protein
MEKKMDTVGSKDGTTIAFDKQGQGEALILVDGAMGTLRTPGGQTHDVQPAALAPVLVDFFAG